MHWVVQPELSWVCGSLENVVDPLTKVILVEDMDFIVEPVTPEEPAAIRDNVQPVGLFIELVPLTFQYLSGFIEH